MKIIRLLIPGKPIAKKRPRFVRRGKFVSAYNEQETEEGRFILTVREQINGVKFDGPVQLHAVFWMPIPKGTSKIKAQAMFNYEIKHTRKPDLDNLVKFVKDCLTNELWNDDGQVYFINAQKRYGPSGVTQLVIVGEK